MRTLALASTIALLGLTSTAEAHFVLTTPPPTNPQDSVPTTLAAQQNSGPASGKGGVPCGPDMMMATTPTAAQGGHPLVIKLVEVVPHDGFYRVALSINSRSELPPDNVVHDATGKVLPSSGVGPDGKTALTGVSDSAVTESTAVFPVLADNMFPHMGAGIETYMGNVTLPNVNCDHCTLQIIEFMHPHGYNGTPGKNDGGGYFYHHCADLKITADPGMPLFNPNMDGGTAHDAAPGTAGDAGAGAGGNSGAAGATGAAGTSGAAGSQSTGAGGTGGQAGDTTGSAGTTTAGSAGDTGTTTGAAGTSSTGAAGNRTSGGSSGCAVVGHAGGHPIGATAFALLSLAFLLRSRRRQ
jgi:MYXO-CTERM domain-containing protein